MLFIRYQSGKCRSENIDVCLIQGRILLCMDLVTVKAQQFVALEGGDTDTLGEISLIRRIDIKAIFVKRNRLVAVYTADRVKELHGIFVLFHLLCGKKNDLITITDTIQI